MAADHVLTAIAATALLTFLLRFVPMLLVRSIRPRRSIERFLKAMPIGILAAIVVQILFLKDGRLTPGLDNHYLAGFLAAVGLAAFTRNLAVVVFGAIAIVAILTF